MISSSQSFEPIIRLANQALESDQNSTVVNTKDIVRNALDAITMLGHASNEISTKRKSNLRYILTPMSSQLLGDDLAKRLKEAR